MLPPEPYSVAALPLIEARFAAPELAIEPAVWEVVVSTNALGLPTRSSCEGHERLELPYVAFGFDYGEHSPEDAAVAGLRRMNKQARIVIDEFVAAFNTVRSLPRPLRLAAADGISADDLESHLPSDNPRRHEDVFTLFAGIATPRSRATLGYQLLNHRQAEMRAFGAFLRRVVASSR